MTIKLPKAGIAGLRGLGAKSHLIFAVFCLTLLLALDALALDNRLKNHPSPYLALHAGDPVAWQDWNAAVIETARKENKLIYLSIGYFSCHWCHVMQRESYRNGEIAAYLNQHFIPVKIDRELEPALDAQMIEFAEATRGMAGWPLNVFVTPEGYPVLAVLYSPPSEFLATLKRVQSFWRQDAKGLSRLARQAAAVKKPRRPPPGKIDDARIKKATDAFKSQAMGYADFFQGGFGKRTKFPSVPQLQLLLSMLEQKPDKPLYEFMELTLQQMARLGLQDHLEGGFFRYTIDPGWTRPHFEKMLYDNALLAVLYLRAADIFDRDSYRSVALRTLDFMAATLCTSPKGACIASLSALDDAGIEGGYYLWDEAALEKILSPVERRAFKLAWGMRDAPPFDDGYLPVPDKTPAEIAKTMKRKPEEITALLARAERKIKDVRRQRGLPRDGKRLAGWNGLALTAFAKAAGLTGDDRYRRQAQAIRNYLADVLWDGHSLRRAVAAGRPVGQVSLQDYALAAQGLLAWAELTKRKTDLALASKIVYTAWKRFYDASGWRLEERGLIPGKTQDIIADGVIPSPAAVLMQVSLVIARKTNDRELRAKAVEALRSGLSRLEKNPFAYPSQLGVLLVSR